ncbi:unnamed protein product [Closterium sp. NIES-53]
MYAVSITAEGDCYVCVPPDPGIEAASLGASESAAPGAHESAAPGASTSALSGTALAQVLHTFTLDSGASRSFFRDRTTLTPLSRSVAVSLADPSGGPVLVHYSTVLPCPAAPSGFCPFTPASQRVTHCTCARRGRHLATFTRRLGSSLYTLTTESPPVAASGQVDASSQVFAAASRLGPESTPCSCRLLSHQTLLWHHRLGHPSLPRLRGMAFRVLVSGLPWSLPPLPLGPAPTCVPCVEGRQRATRHSSEFPPTKAPLQTLHMDMWGPARVCGQGHERYFLLVVDDYSRYTTVFPLRSKGEVTEVLIDWIRVARLQLRERFGSDFPILRLYSDRGGEFSSDLLRAFCHAEGIRQMFTLPASPQQNGIAERRIGMVMDVARTSMIHAAAPRFLWPFAVQYAAHQINLQPRVSMPETSPSLRWTGKVGDASAFCVWGSRAFVRDLSADKLSSRAVPCVFLSFPPDAPVGAGATSPGGAHTGGSRAAGRGGATGAGATSGAGADGAAGVGTTRGTGVRATASSGGRAGAGAGAAVGVGGPRAGGAARGTGAGGAAGAGAPVGAGVGTAGAAGGATGAGAVSAGFGGAVRPRPYFVPLLEQALGLPPSSGPAPSLECPPPVQSESQLQLASPLPAPSPYAGPTRGLDERREPESRPTRPVGTARTSRRVPRQRPPAVPGTHQMALRPSTASKRVPLPSPPASSLPTLAEPESDSLRAPSPTVTHFLATAVTDPSFESASVSALVAELVDFAAHCRLDYATSLVAESASVYPPSVGGECALSTNVLEDRQEEFQCFAAALPHLVSTLFTHEGDPDAPDIPTPCSYAEAIQGPYSSQWQAAMDAEMASWKSTGTYIVEVPPPGANIVSGMWIFRLRCPPGFTGSFPAGTQWSLRRPVYGLRQAPREWHDTLRTTLAALGFTPSTADPSLFLRTDTLLPLFYILVYVDDLVFAKADTARLAHVKSELQKRHTCTDLGELCSYLGLQITRDRARRTITLTQSHMVQQVLQRFDFTYSSPQATPLSTRHSLSALPSDESVESSGAYPELVGCLMYLMTCTRPDLAYRLSILARYVAPGRHRPEHMATAKRVLRYLCSTPCMGLVLGGRSPVVLTGHVDASWVDDLATQRSSQGYTFSLGSGSVSWRSTRSSSALSSSYEAEIYAGAMAAQELRWLTYLLTDLGELPRSPPVLYVDNKAMLALCREHRLEHRTKHIALRYFLARELQQRGQLRLAYVASQANTADIFTKALQPCDHQRFCTMLAAWHSASALPYAPCCPRSERPAARALPCPAARAPPCSLRALQPVRPPCSPCDLQPRALCLRALLPCRPRACAARALRALLPMCPAASTCPAARVPRCPHALLLVSALLPMRTLLPTDPTCQRACPATASTFTPSVTTVAATAPATTATTATATGAATAIVIAALAPLLLSATTCHGHYHGRSSVWGWTAAAATSAGDSIAATASRVGYSARPLWLGAEATSLGACKRASTGAAPVEALHTFTLDSGATRCFFRNCTTVTPLTAPVPVTLADPSVDPVVARASTVLPCPMAPSVSLAGLHLLWFATNLVSNTILQDQFVTVTTSRGELVAIFTDSRTGTHLATFTRRPGSGMYTLTTESAQDLQVLQLHSDRGGEFSSRFLEDFCHEDGITLLFMLPASPQQNGIAERRVGLIMEVARTSMIHAAALHVLWPFAGRYAAHQLNLWPGPAPSGVSGRPTPLVEPLEVSPDTSGPAEGGDPVADDTAATLRSPRLETPPGFPPRPSSSPPQPAVVDSGAAGGGNTGGEDSGGAGPAGADFRGAESGGAGSGGADSRGAASPSGGGVVGSPAGGSGVGQYLQSRRQETLLPQQLREWAIRRGRSGVGAWGTGGGGAGAAGTGGAGARGTGATGARGVGAGGTGGAVSRGTGAGGTGATGAGGVGAGGTGGAIAGGTGGAGTTGTGGAGVRGTGGVVAGGTGGSGIGHHQYSRRQETLLPQQLRKWVIRQGRSGVGAWGTGAGGAGAAGTRGPGARGTGATSAGAVGAGGSRAGGAGGAVAGGTGGTGATGTGGAGGTGAAGAEGAGAGGAGATGGTRTGGAGAGGTRVGGSATAGSASRRSFFFLQP